MLHFCLRILCPKFLIEVSTTVFNLSLQDCWKGTEEEKVTEYGGSMFDRDTGGE